MECNYFYANTYYHAMTLTFDRLTLNICGRSGIMRSTYVHIFLKIGVDILLCVQTTAAQSRALVSY